MYGFVISVPANPGTITSCKYSLVCGRPVEQTGKELKLFFLEAKHGEYLLPLSMTRIRNVCTNKGDVNYNPAAHILNCTEEEMFCHKLAARF